MCQKTIGGSSRLRVCYQRVLPRLIIDVKCTNRLGSLALVAVETSPGDTEEGGESCQWGEEQEADTIPHLQEDSISYQFKLVGI